MRVGQNDGGVGVWSPDLGIILENCRYSTVHGNTMFEGAMKENLVVRGENPGCLVEGNTGTIYGK